MSKKKLQKPKDLPQLGLKAACQYPNGQLEPKIIYKSRKFDCNGIKEPLSSKEIHKAVMDRTGKVWT